MLNGIGQKIQQFTNIYFAEYSAQTQAEKIIFNDTDERFLFYLFDKIVETFASTGEMLALSEREGLNYLKNSTYILLRSILSDIIIMSWLMEDGKQAGETVSSRILSLRRDHIKFHALYLQKMEHLGLLKKEDKQHEIAVLNEFCKILQVDEIDSSIKLTKFPRSVTIREMLNPNNKKNPALVEAYCLYFILSKVEHTGEFTRMIMESTYNKEKQMEEYVKASIYCIESVIKVLLPFHFTESEAVKSMIAYKIIDQASIN